MSDENLPDEGEGIKNLRKQYDTLKKQMDEQNALLAKYQLQERQSQVAGVLKAKGIPESAASLYTGEDVSEASVTKWLEQYADVFGVKPAQSAGAPDPNADAARRVAGNSFGAVDALSAEAGQPVLGDPAELEHLMRTAPIEELQKRGLLPQSGTLFSR